MKGKGVVNITRDVNTSGDKGCENDDYDSYPEGGLIKVHLEDNTILEATHVIGADGKWSNVRRSTPSLANQGKIVTCPSFGVHMMKSAVPNDWDVNGGTVVIKPPDECMFHIIASPVPTGELSISMVCYDETIERYPWLHPPADIDIDAYGLGGWKDEVSALPKSESANKDLVEKMESLLQTEVPAFYEAIGRETINTVRVNRRVSWLQMTPVNDKEYVTYSTDDGRITLIGDAAHAVTPTMGEGCNTAMESGVKLVDAIITAMKDNELDVCTIDALSAAFIDYGESRPKGTIPIQEMSASASDFKDKRG